MDRVVFRKVDSGKGEGEFRGLDRGLVGDVSLDGAEGLSDWVGEGKRDDVYKKSMISICLKYSHDSVGRCLCVSRKTEAKIKVLKKLVVYVS